MVAGTAELAAAHRASDMTGEFCGVKWIAYSRLACSKEFQLQDAGKVSLAVAHGKFRKPECTW